MATSETVPGFSTPTKSQKALITPSPSPPQVLAVKKLVANDSSESAEHGKSDEAGKAATPAPKLKLRFARNIVQNWQSTRSDSTVSPSPPVSTECTIVTSASAAKTGSNAKPTAGLNTVKTSQSKPVTTAAPMSSSDSGSTAVSDNILPSIENAPEDEVEEFDILVAATKKNPARSAKKPATKPVPKKNASKKAVQKPESKTDTPFQKSSQNSDSPPNNETANEVAKAAAASKKRRFGATESTNDKDIANGRPAKVQKVSPPGRKPNVVGPEPIVEVIPPGPDETELTAWLFAYGKEGSEKYLKEKFPRCNIAA